MRIGLPKTAAPSTPTNHRPMFRMEYVRKCAKSSPHAWITIGDKESKGLCNAAAGVRAYVWETKVHPKIIKLIVQLIKTGDLGTATTSLEASSHVPTHDAHAATESSNSIATEDTAPVPPPAKGGGLHLELESFGGFKICFNQQKNDDPNWSAFVCSDHVSISYLDSRMHLNAWVTEMYRKPLATEIEAGCELVNGLHPISSTPTDHVEIIFNADTGARFSRDCSKGFKSEAVTLTINLSTLRVRLDRRTFFMVQNALLGPWARSAGCILQENSLQTMEIISNVGKLLINMEGITTWSETGEATSRGTCAQLLAEDFHFLGTLSSYGIRGRSDYDIDVRSDIEIPRFELFGLPRLTSGRHGEDNVKLPFTKQPLQAIVTPLHRSSAASPPMVKLIKTFRIASYPRLMTTGYTAEAAWEYSAQFQLSGSKIYDDLTSVKWLAGFMDSDDISYADLDPLDPAKAHPYHMGDKTTLTSAQFRIVDSEMHLQSSAQTNSELVVAIKDLNFRSRRSVFTEFVRV